MIVTLSVKNNINGNYFNFKMIYIVNVSSDKKF